MFFSIIRNVYELVVMLVKVKLHGYLNAGTVWSVIDLCEERFDSYPETIQFIAAESGEVTTAGMLELQVKLFFLLKFFILCERLINSLIGVSKKLA
jgi:hypothetical protein